MSERCARVWEVLERGGEIGDPELREHVEECEKCRVLAASFRDVDGMVMVAEEEVRAEMIDGIMKRIPSSGHDIDSWRATRKRFGIAMAATTCLIYLAYTCWRPLLSDSLILANNLMGSWLIIVSLCVLTYFGIKRKGQRAAPFVVVVLALLCLRSPQNWWASSGLHATIYNDIRVDDDLSRKTKSPSPVSPLSSNEMAEDILRGYAAKVARFKAEAARQPSGLEEDQGNGYEAEELEAQQLFRAYEQRTADILPRMLEKLSNSEPKNLPSKQQDRDPGSAPGIFGTSSLGPSALNKSKSSADEYRQPTAPSEAKEQDFKAEGALSVTEQESTIRDDLGISLPKDKVANADSLNERQSLVGSLKPQSRKKDSDDSLASSSLRRVKPRSQQVTGLTFLDPHGYWENTYAPGNALAMSKILALQPSSVSNAMTTINQLRRETLYYPSLEYNFDPPESGALSLSVATDAAAIEGPTRLVMQVGIRGAERPRGSRPPLTMAVVVPPESLTAQQDRARIKQLLYALDAERGPSDQISLVLPSAAIEAKEFRYGTITVVLSDEAKLTAEGLGALGVVKRGEAIIGESSEAGVSERAVLLLAGSRFQATTEVSAVADRLALAGASLSVISLQDTPSLQLLAMRGQGSYRWFRDDIAPGTLVREELLSYGRVVARALRLVVKLSPGAKLVEVVGSRTLSGREVVREKRLEKAIDERISQSLGIETDRGTDDEGIQILIPRFMAGDSHVVLLDLVVDRPGIIAEVELKSKDLVALKNSILSAVAHLEGRAEPASVAHQGVRNNYYGVKVVAGLRRVAEALQADPPQRDEAFRVLAELRRELEGAIGAPSASIGSHSYGDLVERCLAAANSIPPSDRAALGELMVAILLAEAKVTGIGLGESR